MRVLALLMVATLAGCLVDDDPQQKFIETEDRLVADAGPVLVQDHDHMDADLHASSFNLNRVAYHNGVDESGDPDRIPGDTYYTELAVQNGRAYLARASVVDATQSLPLPGCGEIPGNDPSRGGFSILDVREPTQPYHLGTYNTLGGGDIEVSSDDKYVFFSTQRNCLTEIVGNLQENQDPTDVLPRGIHIVDVSDASNPSLAFYQPLPINGPHTLTYHERDGQEFLIVNTYDLYEDPGSGALRTVPVTQRVLIFEIMRAPEQSPLAGVGLRLANTFFLTDSASNGKLFFPHDSIVQQHPNTGQWLMYVAYWDKGVQIVDITDLNAPLTVLDSHTDFSPSSQNAIHQVRPFKEPIGDLHITVAEPEIISATDETGYLTFLDTTDPSNIIKRGSWTLPADLGVSYLEFSPHNFDTWQDKVVLAHNHGGLWVIDAGEENLDSPRSVGYTLDVEQRTDSPRMQPYFWGAFVVDDYIYASDESSGLYVLEYTGP